MVTAYFTEKYSAPFFSARAMPDSVQQLFYALGLSYFLIPVLPFTLTG